MLLWITNARDNPLWKKRLKWGRIKPSPAAGRMAQIN